MFIFFLRPFYSFQLNHIIGKNHLTYLVQLVHLYVFLRENIESKSRDSPSRYLSQTENSSLSLISIKSRLIFLYNRVIMT